jgi:hypothetical protein
MNKKLFVVLVTLLTFIVGVAIARLSLLDLKKRRTPAIKTEIHLSNLRLSGPYEHENLAIFLIHAPDQPNSRLFTPLQEAMERNLVVVHETGEVSQLAIENVSNSEEVLVQAGDIVKGGQQDRALAVDLILPANSGRIPIGAFCVERSRWQPRGGESADHFTITEMVSNKSLKSAIKQSLPQNLIWDAVEHAQSSVGAGVARDVRSDLSTTSLPLALENEAVQESAAAYVNKLSSPSNDAIGFAFAINGKLNGAEVYSSNAQFARFWQRLLKAAAIEAVAEKAFNKGDELVSIHAVGDFLIENEKGNESLDEVTARTHIAKRETSKKLFFETRDMAHGGAWVHRSYLTK